MIESWGASPLAEIDPDVFTDFATVRPQVRLDEDHHRSIVWPTVGVWSVVAARHRRDPRARTRARAAVAALHRAARRDRRSIRGEHGALARCAARRRPPHPPGAADRHGDRRHDDRALRAPTLAVRRSHRDRRRAPGCPAAPRPVHGVALGGGSRLCVADPLAEGGDGARRAGLFDDRHARSAQPARRGRRRVRRPGLGADQRRRRHGRVRPPSRATGRRRTRRIRLAR